MAFLVYSGLLPLDDPQKTHIDFIWLMGYWLINFILKKTVNSSALLSQLVQSKPEILIHDGIIDFKALSRLDITSDELDEVIREHGLENYKHVKLAMFEINGSISVISGNDNLIQTKHKRIHKSLS